ncbi:MAG: tol-pal system-associated acyl-CoA thioesterase [Sneathiella sp.]
MTTDRQMIGRLEQRDDAPPVHCFPVQVYWEDTDAGGIVYYANYLKFIERARTDMLCGLGIHQQQMMMEEQLNFVVRDCHIDYLQPARMDDTLDVETSLSEIKGATMRLKQTVLKQGEILVKSDIRIACLQKNGRPARFSPQIKTKFSSLIYSSGATTK